MRIFFPRKKFLAHAFLILIILDISLQFDLHILDIHKVEPNNFHIHTSQPSALPPLNAQSTNIITQLQDGSSHTQTPTAIPRVGLSMPPIRPDWFKVPGPGGPQSKYRQLKEDVKKLNLHTVCEEAQCPNIGECWNGGTATIMVLGDTCTRGCKFCAIKTSSKPPPPDPNEPLNTAVAISKWGVDYIVITSVDRDDMEDGGAMHFAKTVAYLKAAKPSILIECLVSDFQGNEESVKTLATSGLDVYAHNVETVERLQKYVRDRRAGYRQSLQVLRLAKDFNSNLFTKTSLMLGLGESDDEVLRAMEDMREYDVDVLTLGQYLRPTSHHLSVVEYVTPKKFDFFQKKGEEYGFKYVASGPLIRSSYKAGEYYIKHMLEKKRSQN